MNQEALTPHRHTEHPVLKAAVLSASYERWRQNHHPYPIVVPASARGVMPLSMSQITPQLNRSRDDSEPFKYVETCVDRELERCRDHSECARYRSEMGLQCNSEERPSYIRELGPDERKDLDDTDLDLKFNPNTWVTTVEVRSIFREVSSEDAETIAFFAQPAHWDCGVKTFFKEAVVGKWDVRQGRFIRDSRLENNPSYQLFEHVEWAWSPQMMGGMVNVLEISKGKEGEAAGRVLIEEIANANKQSVDLKNLEWSKVRLYRYNFRLSRCVQSMFAANWERGGLDVDQGEYGSAWVPDSGAGTGTLFVKQTKSIRYSRRADLLPGFSQLLNLLAPSLTSMLMNQIGYHAIAQFLACKRENRARGFRDVNFSASSAVA